MRGFFLIVPSSYARAVVFLQLYTCISQPMISLRKAERHDAEILSEVAIASFLPAHGHSAPKKDIDNYVSLHLTPEKFREELKQPHFNYYLLYFENSLAGYTKYIFNTPNEHIADASVCKLERIYVLPEYYDKKLGKVLLEHCIAEAKKAQQHGIWLAVWTENHRALSFYKKTGFTRVGGYDFKISENHYNPNHIMFLSW